jgi:hypothetical protein
MVVPDQVRDQITALVAEATVVDVPGTNQHTILFSRAGPELSPPPSPDSWRSWQI